MASHAAVAETRSRTASSQTGDRIARLIALSFAAILVAIVGLLVYELFRRSEPARAKFGWGFLTSSAWNPVTEEYGALPFLYGTVVTSLVAMFLSVPLGLGAAIFLSELAPAKLSNGLTFVIELLAAIPSVIYGLLAIFTLVPLMRSVIEPFLKSNSDFCRFFTAPPRSRLLNCRARASHYDGSVRHFGVARSFAGGAARAAGSRSGAGRHAVGNDLADRSSVREAGHLGSVFLGLARALGETMAVTMVIGNARGSKLPCWRPDTPSPR